MAQLADDLFNDTDATLLQNHVAILGGQPVKHASFPTYNMQIAANRVRPSTGSQEIAYYYPVTPASADYAVRARTRIVTSSTNFYSSLVGRFNTGSKERYELLLNDELNTLSLRRFSGAGVATSLASVAATITAGSVFDLMLVMVGDRIMGWSNDVRVLDVTDASPITGAGKPGLWTYQNAVGDGVGHQFSDIEVFDIAAPSSASYTSTVPLEACHAGLISEFDGTIADLGSSQRSLLGVGA